MYDILKKLFLGDKEVAVKALLDTYERQHYAIISYIYFWPIVTHRLFETGATADQKIYKQHYLHFGPKIFY